MTSSPAQKCHAVITSIGTDRPGIVEELSGWILDNGGNIEESRMERLGSEFAALMLVSGPAGLSERLRAGCGDFAGRTGNTVFVKDVAAMPPPAAQPLLRYTLRATSLDHPGLVHEITRLLRANDVNIVAASTNTTSAPFTGAEVFDFRLVVDVPAALPIARFRDELNELAGRANMDIALSVGAAE